MSWRASCGPSPGACRQRRADRNKPVIASQGGASERLDTLLLGKAGGAVAVRRTLATTICWVADPTQVSRPRQLRDTSTVMRLRPAHQSMINRRHDDRASCRARQSLKQLLPTEPRIRAPATGKGGHESGQNLALNTLSTGRSEGLTRLGFCAKLVQSIGGLEPRGFGVDEDVTLRSNSWIVFEGPSRDANDLPIDDGHRSATYRAECASVPRWPIAHCCLVGLDQ